MAGAKLYLLDANVLIDAGRDYYPIARVPEFWGWLTHHAKAGTIKIPHEVYEEIGSGKDDVAKWLKGPGRRKILRLDEAADPNVVDDTVKRGYAPDLTDAEILKVGRDPFLIAYARRMPNSRIVVTTEGSKPKATRANRHVPDVCAGLGVRSIHTFEFIRELNFSTKWKA